MALTNTQKSRREKDLRMKLAAIGATLLSINWKKRTAHYLDHKGNKKTAYAS